jgi:DNA polymerase-3 subunit gamma/tau
MAQDTHYLALYRKYRPQTFDDVRGRDTIVRTLKNQIISNKISHSYLFCGTRGTGKTTIAKIFAKAVNCEHPKDGSPCGECAACRAIAEDSSLNVVEMDAASNNGVDDIRKIIDEVSYSPTQGKYRVYIIDEVHMLSTPAFNALLKTLEEPPAYVIFILATTEPNKLPLTILSRCQRYDFGRLSTATIEQRLREVSDMEHLSVEEKALHYIAGAADGSMRDGLSLLDQCNAFNYENEQLTYDRALEILGAVDTSVFSRFYRAVSAGDAETALQILDEILTQGRELMQFVTDLLWYLRNLMLLRASEKTADSIDVSKENLALMLEDARNSELSEIFRNIRIFSELTEQIRFSASRRILTEAAVIRACRPSMETDTDSLLTAFRQLTKIVYSDEEKMNELVRNGIPAGSMSSGTAADQPASNRPAAGAPAGTGTAGMAAGSAEAAGSGQPRQEPVLKTAVPDDIGKIVGEWKKLLSALPATQSYSKLALSAADLSLGDKGQLLVVFHDPIHYGTFTGDSTLRDMFSEYLAAKTGLNVPIEYRYLDKEEKFTDNYVDLQAEVNMPIDVIDDGSI